MLFQSEKKGFSRRDLPMMCLRRLPAANPACLSSPDPVCFIWRREQDSNPRDFRPTVFKTAAIDHSAIPPYSVFFGYPLEDLKE